MIDFLSRKQKKIKGIKGLCEEVDKNLGLLIQGIEGKYSEKELELIEKELRDIFFHPHD